MNKKKYFQNGYSDVEEAYNYYKKIKNPSESQKDVGLLFKDILDMKSTDRDLLDVIMYDAVEFYMENS